jgi:hypothetical protein
MTTTEKRWCVWGHASTIFVTCASGVLVSCICRVFQAPSCGTLARKAAVGALIGFAWIISVANISGVPGE